MNKEAAALYLAYRIGLHCHAEFKGWEGMNHENPWMCISWKQEPFAHDLFTAFIAGLQHGQLLHDYHADLKELLSP